MQEQENESSSGSPPSPSLTTTIVGTTAAIPTGSTRQPPTSSLSASHQRPPSELVRCAHECTSPPATATSPDAAPNRPPGDTLSTSCDTSTTATVTGRRASSPAAAADAAGGAIGSDGRLAVSYHLGVDVGTTTVRCGLYRTSPCPRINSGHCTDFIESSRPPPISNDGFSGNSTADGRRLSDEGSVPSAVTITPSCSSDPTVPSFSVSQRPTSTGYTTQQICVRSADLTRHNPYPHYFEQNSEQIWDAVCRTVKAVVAEAGLGDRRHLIRSIGFDATCSLVVLGTGGRPLGVRPEICTEAFSVGTYMAEDARSWCGGIKVGGGVGVRKTGMSAALAAGGGGASGLDGKRGSRRRMKWSSGGGGRSSEMRDVDGGGREAVEGAVVSGRCGSRLFGGPLKAGRGGLFRSERREREGSREKTDESPKVFDVWNVIMWMDHRATKQADKINATRHPLIKLVGGKISPEMDIPKILWLKEECPSAYYGAYKMMDLVDFLTYRASGVDRRSVCSVTCKANWAHPEVGRRGLVDVGDGGWLKEFLFAAGLQDVNLAALGGGNIGYVGTPLSPTGLPLQSADELGLTCSTVVGIGLIDAHAGGLGALGLLPLPRAPSSSSSPFNPSTAEQPFGEEVDEISRHLESRVCMISGTSSCFMFTSRHPVECPGVWGPYYGAMVPHCWLLEGGQSASGSLLEWLVQSHPASTGFEGPPSQMHESLTPILLTCLSEKQQNEIDIEGLSEDCCEWSRCCLLTTDIHLTPDVHGNRSPYANPSMRAVKVGCTMDFSMEDLSLQYLAALQALAYGARDVLERVEGVGHPKLEIICMAGGFSKSELYIQQVADICQKDVVVSKDNTDAVLLGSAMLGCAAWITQQCAAATPPPPPTTCGSSPPLQSPTTTTAAPPLSSPSSLLSTSPPAPSPPIDVFTASSGDRSYEGLCGRSLYAAAQRMVGSGRIVKAARDPRIVEYHNRKYKVFKKMLALEQECRDIMHNSG
eukprot:GHVS01060800.1.p1 GENE.GHVS01060800.1~~GHVS01060800.1.p1  ORF type:complete len:988 (-),score=188.37 GHVS01060800.1:422-3385(-)